MRDRNDRYQGSGISALASPKKIGGYLVEAGLLSTDQINVALNDQQATGLRFGEIIVARGWLKEQTVEWVMAKVIEPERQRHSANVPRGLGNQQRPPAMSNAGSVGSNSSSEDTVNRGQDKAAKTLEAQPHKPFVRREVPISKPLPSVGSSDGDVNWVG